MKEYFCSTFKITFDFVAKYRNSLLISLMRVYIMYSSAGNVESNIY